MIRVCFHGAESTGKSALARKLHREEGWPWVPEYGRSYCEERGVDLGMADLLAIAEGQDGAMRRAALQRPSVLILDTDPLMTAVWAKMLFGEVPEVLLRYEKAELYLLFSPDVPWVDDGTRFFGTQEQRARFATLAEKILVQAAVPFELVRGSWDEREAKVRAEIERAHGRRPSPGRGGSGKSTSVSP